MTKEETIGQRFSQLIQELGMTKNAFAISLEKTATVIQHLVEERNKPGFDLLCKVFEVYPNVSKDWLMQGSGPMFRGNDQEVTTTVSAAIPTLAPAEVEAQAGPATFNTVVPHNSVSHLPDSANADKSAAQVVKSESAISTPSIVGNPALTENPVSITPPATPAADTSWQTALYTQQMAHQLAMAELRNQHLQEQQRLMQQMMDLMQRQLIK
ncbi:helix-turn-helix transcriptional regulator [Hymenobacter sp. BT730]|uniref:helix-turn-helix domain-containing protein n=1 Tax=Hymenobacter sp. BT730 TaxID=3063332 RepID=UPI0026DEA43C|nr:helix-turn-helix transcriptional regulator [Hymenobacter sp. BT730]